MLNLQIKHVAYFCFLVVETVVQDGYTLPDHLTIDWIARNLYWTCPKLNKIYVTTLDGSASAVIVDDDLDAPRGIAVDPEYGYQSFYIQRKSFF